MSGLRLQRQARRLKDGASAVRLAAMRERAVVQGVVRAQAAADEAAADAAAAQTAAESAADDAAAADDRISGVLAGEEVFTGLPVDGGEDVVGFLAKVAADVLPTGGLAADAVTAAERDFTAAAQTLTGTTFKTIASKTITTTGERVDLVAGFAIATENASLFGLRFWITRTTGGVVLATPYDLVLGGNVTKDAGGDYMYIAPVSIFADDDPPAGTHTYKLEIWLSRDDCSVQEVTNAYLRPEEVKR